MWKVIPCSFSELNLDVVLSCGQSFRWQKKSDGHWMNVLSNYVWSVKQEPKTGDILYRVHVQENNVMNKNKKRKLLKPDCNDGTLLSNSITEEVCQEILKDYFQLHINLGDLYTKWSLADENFKKIADKFSGIRILRQDPTENLFSFICSSNNNISRISSMVQKLCEYYGQCIGEVDGEAFYSFPSVEALSRPETESKLRSLGFGYRAKFITQTAKALNERDPDWLISLRKADYSEVHQELLQLPGIGAKIADCVSLMSLDKRNAIPVDTHMWQIAVRDYLPHLKKNKTLSAKSYKEIGDFFRERFGDYSGWAHSVLFCSDLKKFSAI